MNAWGVLPEKFIERLHQFTTQEEAEKILNSFCQRKPSTFRANTLKISSSALEAQLEKLEFGVEKVPWYDDAFILVGKTQKELSQTALYTEGFLYMQSLSSMIPPLVLDPKPEESILDMTSAPGSKTTQMAAMMNNTGEIIANDKSKVRLFKLRANLETLGVKNTKITQLPGEFMWRKFPQYFEKTLVDVPCSMEGRFQCDNEKTYRDWSTGKINFLQNQQKFLLRSAISCTQVGGTIIYSTCTLAPEENEEVIDWMLKKLDGAVELENIVIPNLSLTPGLTTWKNKTYHPSLEKTFRILPDPRMEGFFVAKLRKVASTM